MEFSRIFEVRWGDIDANNHLRNTAYSEFGSDMRFALLTSVELTLERLHEMRMGPVLFSEHLQYFRELRLGEKAKVTGEMLGASADGRKWKFRHRIFREDGTESALIEVAGAWMNLDARKIAVPPPEMKTALDRLPRSIDFQIL